MGCMKRGDREVGSEEPPKPNVRNGSPYHTHLLLSPQLNCLEAQKRWCNFTIAAERSQGERHPTRASPGPQEAAACTPPSLRPGAFG